MEQESARGGQAASSDQPADGTIDMIVRSLRHRHAVCEIVLAVQRVELTSLLSRIAGKGPEAQDPERVREMAGLIADVARVAGLDKLRAEALSLRDVAAQTDTTQRRAEGPMLVAGLRLIDHILDASGRRRKKRPQSAPAAPN